jgi:hypothetical protein
MSLYRSKRVLAILSLVLPVVVPALLLFSRQPPSAQSLISGDIARTISDSSGAAFVVTIIMVANAGTGA